jgi:hypothetical protein
MEIHAESRSSNAHISQMASGRGMSAQMKTYCSYTSSMPEVLYLWKTNWRFAADKVLETIALT